MKVLGRINIATYKSLPDPHKTTIIVGMFDMLDSMLKYLDKRRSRIFKHASKPFDSLNSKDLCLAFEEHLSNSKDIADSTALASAYIGFISQDSGTLDQLEG